MKLINKLSYIAKIELLKEANIYDSLEDLYRSVHLMSVDELKELERKISSIIKEHNEKFDLKDPSGEQTPVEEFEFADDMESFSSLADKFDKIGDFKSADAVDKLIFEFLKKTK